MGSASFGEARTINDLVHREETNGSPSGCWAMLEKSRIQCVYGGLLYCESMLKKKQRGRYAEQWSLREELRRFGFAPRSGHSDVADLRC
jgi:hypothetical protein